MKAKKLTRYEQGKADAKAKRDAERAAIMAVPFDCGHRRRSPDPHPYCPKCREERARLEELACEEAIRNPPAEMTIMVVSTGERRTFSIPRRRTRRR